MGSGLVCGVDDAGRGPVIGPLVLAGIALPESKMDELSRLGVRDSKLLSPYARSRIASDLKALGADIAYEEVTPAEIDEVVLHGKKLFKLNFLEAKAMAKVIERLRPTLAYVDASDVNEARFGELVKANVTFPLEVISEHGADRNYPIVSAASILAKVRRDQAIEELRARHGDFGSGYPADPRTIEFLRKWIREKGDAPPFVRKSWKTFRRMEEEAKKKSGG